jgi:hypothetical protein
MDLLVVAKKFNSVLLRDCLQNRDPTRIRSNLRELSRFDGRHDVVEPRFRVGNANVNRATLTVPRSGPWRFAPNRVDRVLRESVKVRCGLGELWGSTTGLYGPGY